MDELSATMANTTCVVLKQLGTPKCRSVSVKTVVLRFLACWDCQTILEMCTTEND